MISTENKDLLNAYDLTTRTELMIKKKQITPDAARLKMADLCARSEQCEYDIRQKLRKMCIPVSEIDNIIEFLIERRFIDDARFAKSFTNDKIRFSCWGKNKIRMALRMKRIPSCIISEAFEDINEDDYNDALWKAAKSKAKSLDLLDYNDRAKLYRHLLSRGYESSLISSAIAALRTQQ